MGDKCKFRKRKTLCQKQRRIPPHKREKVQDEDPVPLVEPEISTSNMHSTTTSSSSKKLLSSSRISSVENLMAETAGDLGNAIVNMNLLVGFLKMFPCPGCCEMTLSPTVSTLHGLAQDLKMECTSVSCDYHANQHLSNRVGGPMSRSYDVNRRFVYAITSIGGHESAARALCGYMNLPPLVLTYDEHLAVIQHAAEQVSESSMKRAVSEAKESLGDDISVSVDGTWQKHGYSSRNGVVTCLSNLGNHQGSKVVDTEVLTTYCGSCIQANNETVPLSRLGAEHNCQQNHNGSAGLMEVEGALRIFRRSENERSTRYKNFLGDGDSKTYSEVAKAQVYGPDFPVTKQECTGHVQKRMGKQLRGLVDRYKGKTLVDENNNIMAGKMVADRTKGEKVIHGVGGINKLTLKSIKSIQGHYGGAIRNNSTVVDMRAAIQAILVHRSGDHHLCPQWCPAVKDGDIAAANKNRLPNYICQLLKPIFDNLSSDELLERCTHGGTQNANEAYHHVLWSRCPKEIFVGRHRLALAVADSTIVFNSGEIGRLCVYRTLGLQVGYYQGHHAKAVDAKRVASSNEAADPTTVAGRKRKSVNQTSDNAYESGAY